MKDKGTQQIKCARPQYIIRAAYREQIVAHTTIVDTSKDIISTQDSPMQQDTQDTTQGVAGGQDTITTEATDRQRETATEIPDDVVIVERNDTVQEDQLVTEPIQLEPQQLAATKMVDIEVTITIKTSQETITTETSVLLPETTKKDTRGCSSQRDHT